MMRLVDAARRLLAMLPALVLGLALIRLVELADSWQLAGIRQGGLLVVASALAQDLMALGRFVPVLLLLTWPALALNSRRARYCSVGVLWSALVFAQLALVAYFLDTHVPLGADLFSYSWSEVRVSVAGSRPDPAIVLAGLAAIGSVWFVLWRQASRPERLPSSRAAVLMVGACLSLLVSGPREFGPTGGSETDYVRSLRQPKLAGFVDSSVSALAHRQGHARLQATVAEARAKETSPSAPILGFHYLDPRYPFLHAETTPDTLAAHLADSGSRPPNLVFLIVEGLGRTFSGPDADLGSFTPFLDELAGRSLYFENFLSAQGRTFAVLPSVFGSLPFGSQGFLALGSRMPEHASLLGVLKGQGYRTRFFCGFEASFDNEEAFLKRQGLDEIYQRRDFGPGYARVSEWGYDDNELMGFASEREARSIDQPFVDVIQTVSMHDPFRFLGQERYRARLEQRLTELGLSEPQKERYRSQSGIYMSVLYTDDALRHYFHDAERQPWFAHTIFLVTGDHRLPEIPMGEWIDRYHVPLIVYSPLLKAPQRIKSVSSQLDIAPSMLALLADRYGLRTPGSVAWLGSGLDLEPGFRNVHEIPLKQTKPTLDTFVQGPWAVNRDALYRLHDGLHAEPVQDPVVLAQLRSRLSAFLAANEDIERSGTLLPAGASRQWSAYDAAARSATAVAPQQAGPALAIGDVQLPARTHAGTLAIDVLMTNGDEADSVDVVPLAVLQTVDGLELSESYGKAVRVPGRGSVRQHIPINRGVVPPGQYYLSVIPSDPALGGRIGDGRFHMPLVIEP
jgi:uncharacterized sulfatase